MPISDAPSDVGFQKISMLAQTYGPFPDYVKNADTQETMNPSMLPSSAYADPVHRQFPCHTKAACYVSQLYFTTNPDVLPGQQSRIIADRLRKAGEALGIGPDMDAILQRHETLNDMSLSSLPDSDFAIVWGEKSASKDRRYPLRNDKEVAAAANWFANYRDEFAFDDRQTIARKILAKSAEFNVTLQSDVEILLEKQAGQGVFDPERAAREIRGRSVMPNIPIEVRDRLTKLSFEVSARPQLAFDQDGLSSIGRMLDDVDRSYQLTSRYGDGLSRPEDALFCASVKQASQLVGELCGTPTGSIYGHSQFANLSAETIGSLFGKRAEELMDAGSVRVEKVAAAAEELSVMGAVELDRAMREVGELPLGMKAGHVGLDPEELEQLAGQYPMAD